MIAELRFWLRLFWEFARTDEKAWGEIRSLGRLAFYVAAVLVLWGAGRLLGLPDARVEAMKLAALACTTRWIFEPTREHRS